MWVMKLKIFHKDCMVIPRAKKFNVTVFSYTLNKSETKDWEYFTSVGVMVGDKKNKDAFIEDLKKDKRVTKFERKGDLFFTFDRRKKTTKHLRGYFGSNTFFVKPVIIKPDGFEYWEIAAWDKKPLMDFYKKAKRDRFVELSKLKKEKITEIYLPNVMQKLTKKQTKAVELAFIHGYYNYPRKVTLEKLAKKMNVSLTTFQEHLRRAEIKLLPIVIERIIHE